MIDPTTLARLLPRVRVRAFAGRSCVGKRCTLREAGIGLAVVIGMELAIGATHGHVMANDDQIGLGFGWFIVDQAHGPDVVDCSATVREGGVVAAGGN